MRYLISFFFFSIFLYGFNYHLKPYKISDGIHCFFGLPSQVSNLNGGNMINSCYVELQESYLVIDSGPTYSYAQEAYTIMKKKKKLPVKYVINTSWDEVHVLGNQFYKEQGAKLLGPVGYKEHMEDKQKLFLESKLSKDALINTRVVSIDRYLDKETTLMLDGLNVNIKALKNDKNHLYVYIENKKIVFAGDIVFNNRLVPINNGRSILDWLDALDKLSKLSWIDIISSHGYMTRRSALKNTKTYLTQLKDEVLEGIKNDLSREEIIRKVKLLSFSGDKFYKTWHPLNVSRAYDELSKLKILDKNLSNEVILMQKISIEIDAIKDPFIDFMNVPKVNKVKIIEKKVIVKVKKVVKKKTLLKYRPYAKAIAKAIKEKRIVLVKVRSTVCKYCDQLDSIIEKNSKVRKILTKYFELVKINTDYETIPMGLTVRSTPTLILIRPSDQKVLMKLAGIRALGELLEILNEAVSDGHNGSYLKP